MPKCTCIVVGDPHFKTSNVSECRVLIERVCRAVDKLKPDFVVCLGDLLHTHETYHETPFNLAIDFMAQLSDRCLTFLLVGNHDYCNASQFCTDRHPYNALKRWGDRMVVVDRTTVYPLGDYEFVFVPYVPPGRFLEALRTYDMWDTADCIFAHQEFYGCKMGAITSTIGDRWDADYPMVISGHIHNAQRLGNVHYVGSAMQHAFGETDDKRIWLCTFDDSRDEPFSYKRINLGLQRKRIVYVTPDQLREFDAKKYEKDSVKLSVRCSPEEYKALSSTPAFESISKNPNVRVVCGPTSSDRDTSIREYKRQRARELDGERGYQRIFSKLVASKDVTVADAYKELSRE